MQQDAGRPEASVVIPTHNRAPLIRRMLQQLTRQDVALDRFEVVVSDDGSSDDTEAVVAEFADRLRVVYRFQDEPGMRFGLACNEGARLASAPVLVFLDGGAMVGPDFVRRHLATHADPAQRRVVSGYAWGCNPVVPPVPGLREALDTLAPEKVLDLFRDNPDLRDLRHQALEPHDFVLAHHPLAWTLFFTSNCSMRAEDFRAVGGFDESFVRWGAEDPELGLRLERHGLTPYLERDAWTIEWPHERPVGERWPELVGNMAAFLRKFPEPAVEIGCLDAEHDEYSRWEQDYLDIEDLTRRMHGVSVAAETAAALRRTGPGDGIVVIGCGAVLPASLAKAPAGTVEAVDFDRDAVDAAVRDNGAVGHHAIGVRTMLPDQCVDIVVVTSRLASVWDRWGESVMAEAHRIGRKVEVFRAP